MANVRISHSKERPYVMLNKNAFEDKNLSWAAIGLWGYLLSKPDDWEVSVEHLSKQKSMGKRDYIRDLLNELIDNGYAKRDIVRDEKGKLNGYDYTIYEEKQSVDALKSSSEPETEIPSPESPSPVKPTLLSNDVLPINEEDICASKAAASFSSSPKKSKGDPSLTKEQRDKLVKTYGEEITAKAIQELADWKESKSQVDPRALNTHSDYRRITKWVIPSIIQNQKVTSTTQKSFKGLLSSQFKNGELNYGYYFNFSDTILEIQSSTGYQLLSLKFKENGFLDQLENFCRKHNVPFRRQ